MLDETQVQAWGECVGRAAGPAGLFVALYGELGAGKSTFARAACRGLGIEGAVPSPTYTLVNVHQSGDTVVYHADLYRISETATEDSLEAVLIDAGWPDVLEADGPVFVEWADLAGGWLPADRWDVRFEFTEDPAVRLVSIAALGAASLPPEFPC
ncbi:MAG: tRNA (adenosine(37)-N6)-threonylcarbamoyltransferase complex ATPase subunit type 1 TsaE [Gemmatimonadales bacterium]|nr:MAG: tRNA (adenosine(37)-N6)-threonylcarbamoyltransferase complex ATPase subunit type 1 TsaE [Gemmatimonadales bacterium]